MEIRLTEARGHVSIRFFSEEINGICCFMSNDKRFGTLRLDKIDLRIIGAEDFLAKIEACDRDVEKLKGLAFDTFRQHATTEDFFDMLGSEREKGFQSGRMKVQNEIREALGIEADSSPDTAGTCGG